MKHGDKAKKSSQGKASGKTAGSKVAAPAKASQSSSKSRQEAGAKAPAQKAPAQKVSAKPAAGGNGKAITRDNGTGGFSNPIVAAAFKRAVKKYPAAFRKLTD
jgi:hypothetical protein